MLSPRSGGWVCAKEGVGQLERHRREEEEVLDTSKKKVQANPMALGKNNISHLQQLRIGWQTSNCVDTWLKLSSICGGPFDIVLCMFLCFSYSACINIKFKFFSFATMLVSFFTKLFLEPAKLNMLSG
jgi:hypothetical protein